MTTWVDVSSIFHFLKLLLHIKWHIKLGVYTSFPPFFRSRFLGTKPAYAIVIVFAAAAAILSPLQI